MQDNAPTADANTLDQGRYVLDETTQIIGAIFSMMKDNCLHFAIVETRRATFLQTTDPPILTLNHTLTVSLDLSVTSMPVKSA